MKERINTPVNNVTIGKMLKQKRSSLGLSLEEVTQAIKIRREYLEALEKDDYSIFASEVYVKGFLKNYTKYLKLNLEKVMAIYRREHQASPNKKNKETDNKNSVPALTRRRISLLVMGVIVILVATFFLDQLGAILAPPVLTLNSPFELTAEYEGDVNTTESSIVLTGETSPQTIIHLNSDPILVDAENKFESDEIPLQNESTLLVLTATNQFGRTSAIRMNVSKGKQTYSEITISIGIKNEPTAFKLITDGEEVFNERAFPGDQLGFMAQQELTIESKTLENIVLILNEETFELEKNGNSFQLKDGYVVRKS